MKCVKCGVELSTIKTDFNLMVKDYSINNQTHVCDPEAIKKHKTKESEAIKDMVKDVKIKQHKLESSKQLNPEIMKIEMDAATKLQSGIMCRCIYWDGKCHHCGKK